MKETRRKPTLFLDRDGVVNERLPGDYVRCWEEFRFLPGALEALRFFSGYFQYIVLVTNQQGIGKGLMTERDLADIHERMLSGIRAAGGRLDGIYYCPERSSAAGSCRKPGSAMAWQAKRDFPGIDFAHAVMVGDSASDMEFGLALDMQVVLIEGKEDDLERIKALSPQISLRFPDLASYADYLKAKG